MATIQEVRDRLGLTEMDIIDVGIVMATNGTSIFEKPKLDKIHNAQMLAEFTKDPSKERHICLWLGLETEEEKMTRAAIESAKSARESSFWAMIAVVVSIASLAISLATLIRNPR